MAVLEYQAVELRTSPHAKAAVTTETIMLNVVVALVPVCAFAVLAFGLSAALLILAATASCLVTERAICAFSGKRSTLGDWSAAITGLLLALTLPPGFPLWMAAVGGFVSIVLGKALFGGLGFNVFNPALVGRAFLQAAFAGSITTWTPAFAPGRFGEFIPSTLAWPFMKPPPVDEYVARAVDGFTGATPLMIMKLDIGSDAFHALKAQNLFFGSISGSTGETCALLILLGGLYLIARKMMDWRISAAVLSSAFLCSGAFWLYDGSKYPSPVFMLFSGGLMLGAMFMATDMVTSPTTPLGVWIFGALIGVLTILIRLKGGLPEGVMYAILLGNAVTPILNNLTQPRIYGAVKAKGKE